MRIALAAAIGAALLSTRTVAAESAVEQPPRAADWQLALGMGAMALPAYPGASALRVMPLPLVEFSYRDRWFASTFRGVGVNAISGSHHRIGISLLPSFGRSDGADARLRGWGSIGATAAARLFAEYLLGPVRFGASVRRDLGAANGTLADATTAFFLPLSRRLFLTGGLGVTWADRNYAAAYFGVTGEQSSMAASSGAPLRSYFASAGLRDVAVNLGAHLQLDGHFGMDVSTAAAVLVADAADSPLTQQRFQPMAGGFVSYGF